MIRSESYQNHITALHRDLNMDTLGNTKEQRRPRRSQVSFAELPTEILIEIFSHLLPVDLKDLRLVCRKWNHAVLDKTAWAKAFANKFGTQEVFATVTGSQMWLPEYFGRVSALKKWAKAKAISQLYPLLNSEYGVVDMVQADFVHDRLMTFARASGSVLMCTLTLGKNQVFIPENHMFTRITAYDANWTYLCVGKSTGEIHIKNLMTATASGSSRLSIVLFSANSAIKSLKINSNFDKYKELADVLTLSEDGIVLFWNLSGLLRDSVTLPDFGFWLDTDFKDLVIVLSNTSIHVVDFVTKQVQSIEHGVLFEGKPTACHADFGDGNIVICHDTCMKVFHYNHNGWRVREGTVPENVHIIDGTMQALNRKRNRDLAGEDGRLYAVTLSDGSVGVFELRGTLSTLTFHTRIAPFSDAKAPRGVAQYTKVGLNGVVLAVGVFADWMHFYDAHSGQYLREGTKVTRRLTSRGVVPILSIEFGPGSSGVVVSGDVVQYFRYGEIPSVKKKPNAPQALEMSRRAMHQHIKSQISDYDTLEHAKQELEKMADKYNGTSFQSEQDELRVAMALSASCTEPDDDLELAIALSERESTTDLGLFEAPDEHPDEEEEEILRRVLELLMIEH